MYFKYSLNIIILTLILILYKHIYSPHYKGYRFIS